MFRLTVSSTCAMWKNGVIYFAAAICPAATTQARQLGSDNLEATTWKRQLGSDNLEATTWKRQLGSDNSEATTRKRQLGSDNLEATTWNILRGGRGGGLKN